MKFEVETAGRRRTIEVRRSSGRWLAFVDGRPHLVDLQRSGPGWSLLIRPEEPAPTGTGHGDDAERAASGLSYEITVEPPHGGRQVVGVNGRAVPVTVLNRGRRAAEFDGRSGSGPVPVATAMPGRVVKVLVSPGETVAARQGLVIVEAMKMENEIRAPRAGVVSEIRAREGAPVERDTILVILD